LGLGLGRWAVVGMSYWTVVPWESESRHLVKSRFRYEQQISFWPVKTFVVHRFIVVFVTGCDEV
jgi:hypothetical protein